MTAPETLPGSGPLPTPPGAERDAALVLAALHLRLGMLALARAELETLAADDGLDLEGRVDLAEVRWRTGDLLGAGEAARQSLSAGDESVMALVIAAEASAALGRPTESRRLANEAQARMAGPIDPIFAGMPRSGVWPADPAEPVPPPTTLFPPDRATAGSGLVQEAADRAATERAAATRRAAAAVTLSADRGSASPGGHSPDGRTDARTGGSTGARIAAAGAPSGAAAARVDDHGPGFWDDLPADGGPSGDAAPADLALPRDPAPPSGLDAATILDAGEAALAAGDYASAALHLGLVVRVAPSIAPAVLAAIGETPDAGLQMVRGDAYRVLGRELDARRAYEGAMSSAAGARAGAPVEREVPVERDDPVERDEPGSTVDAPSPDDGVDRSAGEP